MAISRPVLAIVTLFVALGLGLTGQGLASPSSLAEIGLVRPSLGSFDLDLSATPSRLDGLFDSLGGGLVDKLFPAKSENHRKAELVMLIVAPVFWGLAGFTLSRAQGRRAWLWALLAMICFFCWLHTAVIFFLAYGRHADAATQAKRVLRALAATLALTVVWAAGLLLVSLAYFLFFTTIIEPAIYAALVLAVSFFCLRSYAGRKKSAASAINQ